MSTNRVHTGKEKGRRKAERRAAPLTCAFSLHFFSCHTYSTDMSFPDPVQQRLKRVEQQNENEFFPERWYDRYIAV